MLPRLHPQPPGRFAGALTCVHTQRWAGSESFLLSAICTWGNFSSRLGRETCVPFLHSFVAFPCTCAVKHMGRFPSDCSMLHRGEGSMSARNTELGPGEPSPAPYQAAQLPSMSIWVQIWGASPTNWEKLLPGISQHIPAGARAFPQKASDPFISLLARPSTLLARAQRKHFNSHKFSADETKALVKQTHQVVFWKQVQNPKADIF